MDVDLDARQLIRFQLQRIDGKLTLVEPKTARSRRTIALPQVAVSVLLKHRARKEQEKRFAGSRWVQTGMVFTTGIGTFLDQRNLLRSFYRILDTVEMFHGSRSTLYGTAPRLCCWPKASTQEWLWTCSATPVLRLHLTRTPMFSPRSKGKLPTKWTRFSTPWLPDWLPIRTLRRFSSS